MGRTPKHKLYVRSSWDLPKGMEFDLVGRFVSGLKGFNLSPIPDPAFPNTIKQYVSLDARLAWKPHGKNWEVAIVGQNLLDNHHPEVGASQTLKAPLVEIRRAAYATFTYRH